MSQAESETQGKDTENTVSVKNESARTDVIHINEGIRPEVQRLTFIINTLSRQTESNTSNLWHYE